MSSAIHQEVTIYKGDEVFFVGTVAEAAKELGVKPETILWQQFPCAQKRLAKRKNPKTTVVFNNLDFEEADND